MNKKKAHLQKKIKIMIFFIESVPLEDKLVAK